MSIHKRDREQVVVTIDGDVFLLDATREHEEVGVRFSMRPTDMSLLESYADHVACRSWEGEDRGELKLVKLSKFGISHPKVEVMMFNNGLLSLCN